MTKAVHLNFLCALLLCGNSISLGNDQTSTSNDASKREQSRPSISLPLPTQLIGTWKIGPSFSLGIQPSPLIDPDYPLGKELSVSKSEFVFDEHRCKIFRMTWHGDTTFGNLSELMYLPEEDRFDYQLSHTATLHCLPSATQPREAELEPFFNSQFKIYFSENSHRVTWEPQNGPEYILKPDVSEQSGTSRPQAMAANRGPEDLPSSPHHTVPYDGIWEIVAFKGNTEGLDEQSYVGKFQIFLHGAEGPFLNCRAGTSSEITVINFRPDMRDADLPGDLLDLNPLTGTVWAKNILCRASGEKITSFYITDRSEGRYRVGNTVFHMEHRSAKQ